jgi:hypothetical protein
MWIAVRKKSRLHTWFQAGSLRLFLHPTENLFLKRKWNCTLLLPDSCPRACEGALPYLWQTPGHSSSYLIPSLPLHPPSLWCSFPTISPAQTFYKSPSSPMKSFSWSSVSFFITSYQRQAWPTILKPISRDANHTQLIFSMTSQPSKTHEPKIKPHREEYNSAKRTGPWKLIRHGNQD